MYCPTCNKKLEEIVVNETYDAYSGRHDEEYGLWCDFCKENITSRLDDILIDNNIKEYKERR
jgi:hypothetical protein